MRATRRELLDSDEEEEEEEEDDDDDDENSDEEDEEEEEGEGDEEVMLRQPLYRPPLPTFNFQEIVTSIYICFSLFVYVII